MTGQTTYGREETEDRLFSREIFSQMIAGVPVLLSVPLKLAQVLRESSFGDVASGLTYSGFQVISSENSRTGAQTQ